MEVQGTITNILDKVTGQKKDGSGDWVKQSFTLETTEQYNNLYCFELFGEEKVENFNKYNKVGQEVKVDFNVQTNEWKGKYYTSLQAWKVFKADGVEAFTVEDAKKQVDRIAEPADNDLPF